MADEKIPPERWSIERPFDSAEYLDRDPPEYEDDDAGEDGHGEFGHLPPEPDRPPEEGDPFQ
jgi:hypothetical protein